MATTKTNFFAQTSTAATLKGTTVVAGPKIYAVTENDRLKAANAGQQTAIGAPIDYQVFDLKAAGYAKNGAVLLSLSGTTPQTIDFIDTTTNTPADYAGDTVFATISQFIFVNHSAGAVVITVGASNGLVFLAGTTPSYTVPAGGVAVLSYAAKVIDSSHKTLTFTPASTGLFSVAMGGA